MWSSATASSSPVLTPGRTAAFTALIAPAVTRPEARMSSISCGVLIWIMRPLHFASSGMRARIPVPPAARTAWRCLVSARLRTVRPAESGQGAGGGLPALAERVDPREQPLRVVEPRQRRGLFPVDLQAVPDGLGLVVVALHPLAVDEHATTGEPADQLVLVDDQFEHAVEGLAEVGQRAAQLLGLRDGARETVEQETGLGVGLSQAVAHHGDGDLVGHQVAGVHVDLGLLAQLGLTADVGAEDVAGRDGRNAEPARDDLGLGPLAGPRRAQQHHAHYFRNPS